MTITVFEWIAESTQLNEKKKENFSRSFFASNVFKERLPKIRELLSEVNERLEWISFPMSAAEYNAAEFSIDSRKSLVTYTDSNKNISDTVPDPLFNLLHQS